MIAVEKIFGCFSSHLFIISPELISELLKVVRGLKEFTRLIFMTSRAVFRSKKEVAMRSKVLKFSQM